MRKTEIEEGHEYAVSRQARKTRNNRVNAHTHADRFKVLEIDPEWGIGIKDEDLEKDHRRLFRGPNKGTPVLVVNPQTGKKSIRKTVDFWMPWKKFKEKKESTKKSREKRKKKSERADEKLEQLLDVVNPRYDHYIKKSRGDNFLKIPLHNDFDQGSDVNFDDILNYLNIYPSTIHNDHLKVEYIKIPIDEVDSLVEFLE